MYVHESHACMYSGTHTSDHAYSSLRVRAHMVGGRWRRRYSVAKNFAPHIALLARSLHAALECVAVFDQLFVTRLRSPLAIRPHGVPAAFERALAVALVPALHVFLALLFRAEGKCDVGFQCATQAARRRRRWHCYRLHRCLCPMCRRVHCQQRQQ